MICSLFHEKMKMILWSIRTFWYKGLAKNNRKNRVWKKKASILSEPHMHMQHLSKVYRRGSKNKTLRTHHETGKTFSKDITTSVNKYMTKQLNLKELSNCVINIQHFSTSLTTCVHICAYTYIYIYMYMHIWWALVGHQAAEWFACLPTLLLTACPGRSLGLIK